MLLETVRKYFRRRPSLSVLWTRSEVAPADRYGAPGATLGLWFPISFQAGAAPDPPPRATAATVPARGPSCPCYSQADIQELLLGQGEQLQKH